MQKKKIPAPRKLRKVVLTHPDDAVSTMLVVTTDTIPGRKIKKVIGLVMGNSAQVLGIAGELTAGLGQILSGGDVPNYNSLLQESRNLALARLKKQAVLAKANAVVGLRFASSDIMNGLAEVCVYGTAVELENE